MDAINEIREYAQIHVDEGQDDAAQAITDALNQLMYESSMSGRISWDLIEKVFSSDEILEAISNSHERIHDYVNGELYHDVKQYVEDSTYYITYPAYGETDTFTNKDAWLEKIAELTGSGEYTLASIEDHEAMLTINEDEED